MRRIAAAAIRLELPLLALWAVLAFALSSLTTRVVDWYVMTDELLQERLAISVARLGSPLPRVHGELIPNVSQLYPLLIAPAFRHGLVPDSLHDAHTINAWVMSSACIPAYLLARRVTGRRIAAYAIAVLTVCLPWIVLSSFLLTEVAGYPAFLWAVLTLQLATVAPSRRNDVLALLGLGLAVFARTQLAILLVALPLALLAHELGITGGRIRDAAREIVDRHRVLAVAYAVLGAGAIALAATGRVAGSLGAYADTIQDNLLPSGIASAFLEHVSILALGLAIVPFVVGVGWLLANVVRPQSRERHAFACIASVTIVAVLLEVTLFDLRSGAEAVRDRYLFYLAPLALLGFVCALLDTRRPRRALVLPAALVAFGFALVSLPAHDMLDVDSPVSVVNDSLLQSTGSLNGARFFLVVATVVLTVAFVQATSFLSRRVAVVAFVLLTLVVLPLESAYAFATLFRHDGASGRPVTLAQGGVFDWLDKTVGRGPDVTIIPYPTLPGRYRPSVADWWDLEFWNLSVARSAQYPGQFEWTPDTFPKLSLSFAPRTGLANVSPTRYVVQSAKDSRFRVSGAAVSFNRDMQLIEAEQPWRTDWQSFDLDDDGWTRPGVPATVRVYAVPGQQRAVTRTLTVGIRAPQDVAGRRVDVSSTLERWHDRATSDTTLTRSVKVCVPPSGFGTVRIRSAAASTVYGDMRDATAFSQPREAGVHIVQIALADEVGPPCGR